VCEERACVGELLRVKSFRRFAEAPAPEDLRLDVVSLIHEAGTPYYDWFFGNARRARAAVEAGLASGFSEISADRVMLLLSDDRLAGLYVALTGEDLAHRRAADVAAVLRGLGKTSSSRQALIARLETARALFAPVAPGDFYLSKLGVRPAQRSMGIGRALVDHFLSSGREAGCKRFRLDVSAHNPRAIRLYQTSGFSIVKEHRRGGMAYLEMAMNDS